MRESVTYQAILREGRAEGLAEGVIVGIAKGKAEGIAKGKAEGKVEGKVEEARQLLLRIGARKLGPADATVCANVEAMQDLDGLENLAARVLDVKSWNELFDLE